MAAHHVVILKNSRNVICFSTYKRKRYFLSLTLCPIMSVHSRLFFFVLVFLNTPTSVCGDQGSTTDPCGWNLWWKSGTGTGFLCKYFALHRQLHSTNASSLFVYHRHHTLSLTFWQHR